MNKSNWYLSFAILGIGIATSIVAGCESHAATTNQPLVGSNKPSSGLFVPPQKTAQIALELTHTKAGHSWADVQDVLEQNCARCHNSQHSSAGIDLTNYSKMMHFGTRVALIKPGQPNKSLLFGCISGNPHILPMPYRLPTIDIKSIKTIQNWIQSGAKKS